MPRTRSNASCRQKSAPQMGLLLVGGGGYLFRLIIKVISNISLDGVLAIFKEAGSRPLPRPGKVRFQGACARVCFAHRIRVIGPDYPKVNSSLVQGHSLFLNIFSKSGNMSMRSLSLKMPHSMSCDVRTCLANIDCTTFVRSRQSMQLVRTTEVCCFTSSSP